MKISRREFLKWCTASAAAMGITKVELDKLETIVMAAETAPSVIWLQGSGCSGCTISLLNAVENTTIDNLLLNQISMKYHSSLMVAAGQTAMSIIDDAIATLSGKFILVVEGGIPTANNGIYCVLGERNGSHWTMVNAVRELAPHAKYIVNAGTCSSFGGVAKLGTNPTGVTSVSGLLGTTVSSKLVNLPGCPVHPYTLTKTLIDLLLYGMPSVDYNRMPRAFYSYEVHDRCPFREYDEVKSLGVIGCYEELGCKGPSTYNDCPTRKWNNKVNWCIGAGHMCIGCAGKNFGSGPIYKFGTGTSYDD
ncbi:hydrogenase small subunit [Romboutsia sp.]|uniref:hydrogenase small subunit n=1 Tax=Romboutsia sp. TaxID=1965302 RepID=UPI002CB7AEA5|nr:hydrogenase small subunit [Romboutsia sp.]HSQ87797.1 hydrogenase small subunit [Romboutsia sp.]